MSFDKIDFFLEKIDFFFGEKLELFLDLFKAKMCNTYEFTFDVTIKNEKTGVFGEPIRSEEVANEVAKWYYSLSNRHDYYTNLSFQPKKCGNVYHMYCRFRFVNAEEDEGDLDFHQQLLRDPDNGNHPITIDNEKYLVIGSELEN